MSIIVLSALYCTAQELQPGFKTGFSLSHIKGSMEHSKDFTGRVAPYFGISFGKSLSPLLNIRTELNYAAQGDKSEGIQPLEPLYFRKEDLPMSNTGLYANFTKIIRLNYLEVPVFLQFGTKEKQEERHSFFHIDLGPYLAYRIKAKLITSGTSQIYLDDQGTSPVILPGDIQSPYYSFDKSIDLNGEIKRMNAGIIAGIGGGYKYDNHKFFVDARINKGLINIHKSNGDSGNIITSSFIFSAGYIYCFKYLRGPIVSIYVL